MYWIDRSCNLLTLETDGSCSTSPCRALTFHPGQYLRNPGPCYRYKEPHAALRRELGWSSRSVRWQSASGSTEARYEFWPSRSRPQLLVQGPLSRQQLRLNILHRVSAYLRCGNDFNSSSY